MSILKAEESFEIIQGDCQLSCALSQDQHTLILIHEKQESIGFSHYFRKIINKDWIEKDQLSKISYISPQAFYSHLKSRSQSNQLILKADFFQIDNMISVNGDSKSMKFVLEQTEYTYMEKSLILKNKSLNQKLLESQNNQNEFLESIKQLTAILRESKVKIEQQTQNVKKLNNKIEELQENIRNIKEQNLIKIKKLEKQNQKLQKQLSIQKKKIQVYQLKRAQCKQLNKINSQLKFKNQQLTNFLKKQNQVNAQKVKTQKQNYEAKQLYLRNLLDKEKQQHDIQYKKLENLFQNLQLSFREHLLQLDITTDSYFNLKKQHQNVEIYINQKLLQNQLQKQNHLKDSIYRIFVYLQSVISQKSAEISEIKKIGQKIINDLKITLTDLAIQKTNLQKTKETLQQNVKQLMEQNWKLNSEITQSQIYNKQLQEGNRQKYNLLQQFDVYALIKKKQQKLLIQQYQKRLNEQKENETAQSHYGKLLIIDKKKNWIFQFDYENNICDYGGINKLSEFNTSKIIKINLYQNSIGDQGWLQLVNLKLDNLQSLKAFHNSLILLKDIYKISHIQQLLIADDGGYSNKLTKQSAALIVNTRWPNLKTLSVDFKYRDDSKNKCYSQLPGCFNQFVQNKFINFPVLTELYCGDYISSQSYNSLVKCSQIYTNSRIKILQQFKLE